MKKLICCIILLSFIACADLSDDKSSTTSVLSRQKRKVLTFPPNTVLQVRFRSRNVTLFSANIDRLFIHFFQLTMCIISQISFIPSHRTAVNVGFNVNYALPYTLSSIYSPMFWARTLSGQSNPIMTFFDRFIESESGDARNSSRRSDTTTEVPTTDTDEEEYDETTVSTDEEDRVMRKKRNEPEMKGDMTAAEFYLGMKEILM